jgi:hypothetical protein
LAIPLRTDEWASAAGIARSFAKRAPDALRELKLPHNSAAFGAKLGDVIGDCAHDDIEA